MIHMLGLLPDSITVEDGDAFISDTLASLDGAEGLIDVTVSTGPVMSPTGPPSVRQVFQARWSSFESMMAWAQSQGDSSESFQTVVAGGATLIYYEVKDL